MRSLFADVTGLDIFESKTIASACMKEFQMNHLPNSSFLPLVTEKGYGIDKKFHQSTLARKFLRWYEQEHGVTLRTSDSANWEKQIAGYYVDGFLEAKDRPGLHQKDLVVEVHGCFWFVC